MAGVFLNESTYPNGTSGDVHVLMQLIGVIRRRWKIVATLAIAGAIIGFGYAEIQTPQYTSSATVMVRSGPSADPVRPGIQTSTPEEEGQFLSQLELAKSLSVTAMVETKLNLAHDAAFSKSAPGGLARIAARLRAIAGMVSKNPDTVQPLDEASVLAKLQAGVGVSRAGRTYVAAISFLSPDPDVARKVAQAYAEAFRDKLDMENQAANARAKAALEAQIAAATGSTKDALQAKYVDMLAERALPGIDAIILSDAKAPVAPVLPRKSFLLVVGAILGAGLGCLWAGMKELTDLGARDGYLVSRRLGLRFLGYLPSVTFAKPSRGMSLGGGNPLPEFATVAITTPFSPFAETIRSISVTLQQKKPEGRACVAGIVPILGLDGGSFVAVNLATHLASQGKKVLLIDADWREESLSGALANGAGQGVIDCLLKKLPVGEAALHDGKTNLTFLPAALNGRMVEPAGLLSSPGMGQLIEDARVDHDFVIVDLAALTRASDARAFSPLADTFVIVGTWGSASVSMLEEVLSTADEIPAKAAGFVFNRTDLKMLPLYASAGSTGSYQRRISRMA
jgi:succinoglycan biosynthesis transport protein ExoP